VIEKVDLLRKGVVQKENHSLLAQAKDFTN
jgi:hypothetical protein